MSRWRAIKIKNSNLTRSSKLGSVRFEFFIFAVLVDTRKKRTIPKAPTSSKTVLRNCAFRDSNPGHPD